MKYLNTLLAFCIVFMLNTCYAQNIQIKREDVTDIVVSVTITPIQDSKYCYYYITKTTNEIAYIAHYLNSLDLVDDGEYWGGGDIPIVNISVVKKDKLDKMGFISGRFYDTNDKQYGTDQNQYNHFVDFVYALKTGKVVLEDEITFEPSDWAKEVVNESIEAGLLPKWNQIAYTSDISRVEVCQLTDNLLTVKGVKKKESSEDYPFDDTSDISVKEMYSQGIVEGKSDTEFCPWDNITREEFAKILADTCDIISVDDEPDNVNFTYFDEESVSDWALENVKTVTTLGLMQGDENGCFNPQDNITKEQVVSTLLRLSERQTKNQIITFN